MVSGIRGREERANEKRIRSWEKWDIRVDNWEGALVELRICICTYFFFPLPF